MSLLIMTLLQSCCSDVVCDCWDDCDKSLCIEFDTSKQSGFSIMEIDTIKIITLDTKLNILQDTTIFLNDLSNKYNFGNCAPKFGFDIQKLFKLQGEINRNYDVITSSKDTFRLREMEIEGHMSKGCCSCYELDKKAVIVDGVINDFSSIHTNPSGGSHVILKRK